MAVSEIHTTLMHYLKNALTEDDLQALKEQCKAKKFGGLGAGQLEKIRTVPDLLSKLQQKRIFQEGGYENLKVLLERIENEEVIGKIEEVESQLQRAGIQVQGMSPQGSQVMQRGGPFVSSYPQQYQTAVHRMHPYTSFPAGHDVVHKSDAFPSGPFMSPEPMDPPLQYDMAMSSAQPNQAQHGGPANQSYLQPNYHGSEVYNVPSFGQYNNNNLPDEEYYQPGRGYFLFINNHFKAARGRVAEVGQYDYREGADIDTGSIKDTHTQCLQNFELDIQEEVGKDQFWRLLENVRLKLREGKYSSFIFIISSHGIQTSVVENGQIYNKESIVLEDSSTVTLEEIRERFNGTNAPFLINKPKVFIVQACRGLQFGKGVPDIADCMGATPARNLNQPHQLSWPENADELVAYATSEGTKSWRNSNEGTWYINHLCQEIRMNAKKDHFLDLLLRIHRKIAVRESNTDNPAKQMPCYVTTFTKKFMLY